MAKVNRVFIQKTYKEEQTVKIKAYFQRNLIELGGSRNAAVKGLKKEFPEYFKDMDAHYLKTVSASHINTARLWSNAQLYKDAGYKELELIVILDERTTQICTNLSGLTFKIESTIKTLEAFYSAKTYQEMADARPYLRDERLNGELTGALLYDKGGQTFRIDQNTPVEDLEKAGIAGPPFHHLCRTTVGVKI